MADSDNLTIHTIIQIWPRSTNRSNSKVNQALLPQLPFIQSTNVDALTSERKTFRPFAAFLNQAFPMGKSAHSGKSSKAVRNLPSC